MAKAKHATNVEVARALVDKHPKAPSLTLAKRLYRENPQRYINLEAARTAVRYVRGATGVRQRRQSGANSHPRIAKAGWKPELPPSQADPWEPFDLGAGVKVLVLSDAHIPYHDDRAVKAAVAWGKKANPDVVLLNGDWADFYSISRWDKCPDQRDLVGEIECVRQSLAWLRSCFPKARIVYKKGNHEERWDLYIWNKAADLWKVDSCQMENILKLDELGIESVGDKRIVLAGKLPILHGHEPTRGIGSPVSQARGMFLRMNHSNLTAHGHRTSSHTEADLFKNETTCWSSGCLCSLNPQYMPINKWDQSFAYIEAAKDGQYDVSLHRLSRDYVVRAS
jgi:predicted phosphodiesterase